MNCRPNCGACCIAPSINNPIPGMPNGKPAGVMCANLDPVDYHCRIWGTADYPDVCRRFLPAAYVCGSDREQALKLIGELERSTK
ncbi:YkgJ family cysteine cluster protein [Porticoccus sp. W117]|uniref:YkgJ family cysteine cluster protein n=1 Tax=Porticoccus sp. W117 TaxID=3054777 RepID=UPI00259655D7|nr:YkgJ family cysteine cluster protein [Porticoccus sp. W117]MDM3872550.1 YkgJ family cysteine cluster protein [Porticoccus sp. W117]